MIVQNGKTTHMQGKSISYIIFENDERDLLHFYFGKKISDCDYSLMTEEWKEEWGFATNEFPLDVYPQEYPSYGHSDLRSPAYQAINKYGNMLSQLKVREYKIHSGQTADIKGMPCLLKNDKNADTLEVVMTDEKTGLEADLFYTVFDEYDIIARSVVFVNRSDAPTEILSAYSANLDLPVGNYDMIHFAGAWGREREMIRTPLKMGLKAEAENARGGSGHQVNPFIMIADEDADEERGEVYGLSLIYSGNHSSSAKIDQFGSLRVQQGINPHQFSCVLQPGDSFYTPQTVICYSDEGFGKMSREYHDVYRNNLMRAKQTKECRPVLINNWEGTYFDFTEEKLLDMAKCAKDAGVELFVLDDGWFGKRNCDRCSLGDWTVNKEKLPSGIDGLAKKMNDIGLKFGLWFEPEMVNPDSELYRKHPDWAVKANERTPVEMRNQLVLDLSRDEVCRYVIEAVSNILSSANIEYVKWDMNRHITDMPYRGYNHKYTLGFYKVMSAITEAFPDVLFEGCSAGGGRFDAGVLAYMPQIWTSDNSDAVSRLKIQYSTSMCYPVYSISSHVTASPNHQCGRITCLKTRADTAYMGTFGYELDITKATDEEYEEIKRQIEFEKEIRSLMCSGDLYRLKNPYEGNYCAWEIISKNKDKVFVFASKILAEAQSKNARLKLRGLIPEKDYKESFSGRTYKGDFLINHGIKIPYKMQDFATEVMVFDLV